jgi:hypothetical protein
MAFRTRAVILLAACALAACDKEEEAPKPKIGFRVQSVELGKSVGQNKRVVKQLASFLPRDTVFAVVNSIGTSQRVTMVATWQDARGGTLAEYTQLVAPSAPAATEFHLAHAKGFPVGKYAVVVTANGTPVATKGFEVTRK